MSRSSGMAPSSANSSRADSSSNCAFFVAECPTGSGDEHAGTGRLIRSRKPTPRVGAAPQVRQCGLRTANGQGDLALCSRIFGVQCGTTQNLCQPLELGERLLGLGDVIRCQRDCHDCRQQAATRRSPSRLRYGAMEPMGCGGRVALPESQQGQPGLDARSEEVARR